MGKKRIAILTPYPYNEAPSQRFRFEQYLSFLNENDFEYTIFPFLDLITWEHFYSKGKVIKKLLGFAKGFFKRVILLFTLRKYDHVFIHREAAPIGPPIFEFIISKILGKKYIYDFDDAIWMANFSQNNARFHRLKAYWKVKFCIKWAGKVSAGNEFLASYARKYNSKVRIIPTTIDTENHHNSFIDYQKEPITIGWTGTHTTLRYLLPLLPVFKSISEKYNVQLVVISNENPHFDLVNFKFIQWKKESEIEDLKKISIGLMPLEMDQWSEGKCGFKGLQYMALGIPTVVSPVGVNTKIVEHGINGFLAKDLEEWKAYLEQLILNSELRERIGRNGREKVISEFSVLAVKHNFIQLFTP
jgi:glycosyltransferase involved in cell wall biosynthesis